MILSGSLYLVVSATSVVSSSFELVDWLVSCVSTFIGRDVVISFFTYLSYLNLCCYICLSWWICFKTYTLFSFWSIGLIFMGWNYSIKFIWLFMGLNSNWTSNEDLVLRFLLVFLLPKMDWPVLLYKLGK